MKAISSVYAIVSLLVSNAIPLFGVIFFHWNVFLLMILYWFENVIIGVFTVLKMKIAEGASNPESYKNVSLNGQNMSYILQDSMSVQRSFFLPFFMLHFGIFTMVHGIFVAVFFFNPNISVIGLLTGIFSLSFSHFLSYRLNYIDGREYKRMSIGRLFVAPYPRVIVMHIVVILGGMFAMSQQTEYALALLVGLKTVADIGSHIFEHRKSNVIVRSTT